MTTTKAKRHHLRPHPHPGRRNTKSSSVTETSSATAYYARFNFLQTLGFASVCTTAPSLESRFGPTAAYRFDVSATPGTCAPRINSPTINHRENMLERITRPIIIVVVIIRLCTKNVTQRKMCRLTWINPLPIRHATPLVDAEHTFARTRTEPNRTSTNEHER